MGETRLHLDDFHQLGKYTVMLMVMLEIMQIIQCGNVLFMVFGGAAPSIVQCKNMTVLPEHDMCRLYHEGKCEPVLDYQFYSVNVEFEHLCEDTKEVKDSTSLHMVGYLLGSLFFGQISDVYGRKWPMFFCCLLHGIFGVASAFSTSLKMFSYLKLLMTFFCTGHIVISGVYMGEMFPKQHRMWMFFAINWSPNIVVVTLLAYVCGDWRTFSLVLNSLAFVACTLLIFTHETAYFLIRKGRIDEAEEVTKKIYKFDGSKLDEVALEKVLSYERRQLQAEASQYYFYHHLFCTWKFVSWSATILFLYFSVSLINYGILFNLDTLSGSLFFNAAMTGVFRCVLNIVSAVADIKLSWLGRKKSHAVFSSYTLFSILVALLLQQTGLHTVYPLLNQFLLIGACSMVCQIYSVASLGAMEIFPTPIRNVAFASTQFAEALATILSPQLFLLSNVADYLPFLVLAILQVGELVSYHAFIPESKGQPLADKMPSHDRWIPVFRPKAKVREQRELVVIAA